MQMSESSGGAKYLTHGRLLQLVLGSLACVVPKNPWTPDEQEN
jgi:hypothetical protein